MQRSRSRLFPLFLVVIIAIIIIIAIVSIVRAVFNSSRPSDNEATNEGQTALLDTSANHSVKLTVRGPIVANENFTSYTVSVSPGSRTMTVYKGYLDDVQKQKSYGNNEQAYEQFVYALDKANMMKGTMPDDDAKNDLRGICARGYVYEYAVLVDSEPVKHLWTSSTCEGSKGTLDANVDQLNDLFLKQIPGSSDLVPFKSTVGIGQLHL